MGRDRRAIDASSRRRPRREPAIVLLLALCAATALGAACGSGDESPVAKSGGLQAADAESDGAARTDDGSTAPPPRSDAGLADGRAPDAADASDASVEPCVGEAACIIFITSSLFRGDLGGKTADEQCQDLADAPSSVVRVPHRVFKAWISDATGSAATRLVHSWKPYVRPDGALIASSWSALTGVTGTDVDAGTTELVNTISVNERGERLLIDVLAPVTDVWTGTWQWGAPTGFDCGDWKTNFADASVPVGSPYNYGSTGDFTSKKVSWTHVGTFAGAASCADNGSFYCVQQ